MVVHDAARPLVTRELVEACLDALMGVDGAIAAAPVTDTVKEAYPDGTVLRTLDRSRLWAVQTPQVFRADALRRALDVDDARSRPPPTTPSLVEAAGGTRAARGGAAGELQGDDARPTSARAEARAVLTDYHVHLRPDEDDSPAERYFTQGNAERYRETAAERGIEELGVAEHIHRFVQSLDVWTHPWYRHWARRRRGRVRRVPARRPT